MSERRLLLPVSSFLLTGLIACSQLSNAEKSPQSVPVTGSPISPPSKTVSSENLTQLFSRIWRVTKAPSKFAPGTIFVFLPNGTLVQTSCVETYRIATWTSDKKTPNVLRVVEDGKVAFTATIAELTDTTLQLKQNLVRSNEQQDIILTAVEQESVCPDLPK